MKHYTIELHESNGKGALLEYVGIDAENKKDLQTKVKKFNEENSKKYLAIKTAFVLHS